MAKDHSKRPLASSKQQAEDSSSIITNKAKTKKVLEQHFKEQLPEPESEFPEVAKKTEGLASGYVAKHNQTGDTYMIKGFPKRPKEKDLEFWWDGIRELLAGNIVASLLYNRAPKIELVTTNKEHVAVRSKYLKNVQSLSAFSGGTDGDVNASASNLQNLDGFEKAIAAALFSGDRDYHAGNLMVHPEERDGKVIYVVDKIDHGRALLSFSVNFEHLINVGLYSTFAMCGYDTAIYKGNLNFNISKFAAALRQMVEQSSTERNNDIIDAKIAELKKAGVAFTSEQEKELEAIKTKLAKNLDVMKESLIQLSIIEKYSNVSHDFKNGRWLDKLAQSPQKDGILFAMANKIEIEGLHPIAWCLVNKHSISGQTPIEYINAHPEQQITVLNSLLERYMASTNNQERQHLSTEYNGLVQQINGEVLGGAKDSFSKFINVDSYTLSRKIGKIQKLSHTAAEEVDDLATTLMCSCSIELVAKMCDIGKEIAGRKNAPILDLLKSFINACEDFFKRHSPDRISRADIKETFQEIDNALSKLKSSAPLAKREHKTPISSFAEAFKASEKTGHIPQR